MRHFLDLSDAGGDAIAAMINDAQDRKGARADWPKGKPDSDAPLAGHVLGMIFEKNSTRPPATSMMKFHISFSCWSIIDAVWGFRAHAKYISIPSGQYV